MVRHASLFSQLVAFFNRQRSYELVYRHSSDRYAKGFSSWDQLVAMLFCQLAQEPVRRLVPAGGLQRGQRNENHLEGDPIGPGPRVMGGSGTNPEPSRTSPGVP
jgi:hypothetical protein